MTGGAGWLTAAGAAVGGAAAVGAGEVSDVMGVAAAVVPEVTVGSDAGARAAVGAGSSVVAVVRDPLMKWFGSPGTRAQAVAEMLTAATQNKSSKQPMPHFTPSLPCCYRV